MFEMAQYEGCVHELAKWAVNRGTGQNKKDSPPEPYRSWVAGLLPKDSIIGYHVGVITPDTPTEDGWVKGYPHAHIISVGWDPDVITAVTYLAVADEGGEFGIGGLSPGDAYTFLSPRPGLTTIMDAVTYHGVRAVRSGTRIALITSGVPN